MKKTYDLAVVTGTYLKDGREKNRYQNVGVVLDGEKGPMILLDRHFNPAGIDGKDGRIVLSMFAADRPAGGQTERRSRDDMDDDIPF